MRIQVLNDADTVAREAAKIIAAEARDAVGRARPFHNGRHRRSRTWQMLRALGASEGTHRSHADLIVRDSVICLSPAQVMLMLRQKSS